MELIERAGFLASLQTSFENMVAGEGHCMLISGEAGIGKTSLVRVFCLEKKGQAIILQGSCDALFAPRPLAPLYDIVFQLHSDVLSNLDTSDRTVLFSRLFHELSGQKQPVLVIFEDIHWADEATLDFIKFLARRIRLTQCLFILTFRDNEVNSRHPLRSVLGQLPPGSFTRLQLPLLSREAVETMATGKGYSGEDVYNITGGNPFYVNEILASYSPGVPDNIKDSILAVYNRYEEKTKRLLEILSVLPTGFEEKYLVKMETGYFAAIENLLDSKILLQEQERILFKHELYRRTIESSLSPLTRVALNKKILELFLDDFERNGEVERIIHHAKNANDYDTVVQYAPIAAKAAAQVGAHTEAAKLFYTAIEYYQGIDKEKRLALYEAYAYECYLTNQIKEAIIYQGKALSIHKEGGDKDKIGDCMRFLSRLWWFDGNKRQSESYGNQAIEILQDQPSSKAKAMAFSNMSQLKMLSDQIDECLLWGEKAIAIAQELADDEILSHTLNNVGTVQIMRPLFAQKGRALLQQSLELALKNMYHEHAARAYTNLATTSVAIKDHDFAEKTLDEGIAYCQKMELNSWYAYMSSQLAKLYLNTGRWEQADGLACRLIENELQAPIVKIGALIVLAKIKMRKGYQDALPLLLEAKIKAFETLELQRIIPVLVALLEYEWITGEKYIEQADIDSTIGMMKHMGNIYDNSEFACWLLKARMQPVSLPEIYEGYQMDNQAMAVKAAKLWQQMGCPYEQALALFGGTDVDKKNALMIVQSLGADAVYKKMEREMRSSGIKSIPRGIRKSTRSNAAHLTGRELDVLKSLKEGLQNKEIADKLFISPKTVDHHISSILLKLGVNSRTKAVREAIGMDIIK